MLVPRTATTGTPHPDAIEFVRFCYHRRRVGWPDLYDEMCAVAARGLFRGFSADDLGGIGVGFSLFDMPALAGLAAGVVAEDAALRRPVTVVINAAIGSPPEVASAALPNSTAPTAPAAPAAPAAPRIPDERSFDVPIRLALAPTGA